MLRDRHTPAQVRTLLLLRQHRSGSRVWFGNSAASWSWFIDGKQQSLNVDKAVRAGLAHVDGDRVTLTPKGERVADHYKEASTM